MAADLARGGMRAACPGGGTWAKTGRAVCWGVIGVGAFGRQRGCPRVALFCVSLVESCCRVMVFVPFASGSFPP